MGTSHALTAYARPLRVAAILVLGALLTPPSATAEIIIDNFDDPVLVISPEMEGELIETENVGQLGAKRTVLIYGGQSDPEATLDISLTSPSLLTGNFIALNPPSGAPLGLGRIAFDYEMNGTSIDLTETGANDAIFVDVTSIVGPTPPPFFYALVRDHGDSFEAFFDLSSFSAPGTIALPFDHFGPRGGGVGNTDFKAVSELFFHVLSNGQLNGIEERGWNIQIDRVRVGTMVPEPYSLSQWALVALLLVSRQSFVRYGCLNGRTRKCFDRSP